MAITYTHDFDFTIGSEFVRGEMKFLPTNKPTFVISSSSDPISMEFMGVFKTMMNYMDDLNKIGALKKMKVVLK